MISEVLNALLLTYLATEYSVASHTVTIGRQETTATATSPGGLRYWRQPRYILPCLVVVIVNLVERLSFLGNAISGAMHEFMHIPKILFAAACYVVVLYYDCRRVSNQKTLRLVPFLQQVGWAFVYVVPVYPALAVLISFGFMIVINVFEFLHIDQQILNWPIYYGVLYGPFSFVYWRVKETIVHQSSQLPTSMGGGRTLGA